MKNRNKLEEFSELAAKTAELIAEGRDWSEARSKIAEFNDVPVFRQPSDEEIESALRCHYSIYDPQGHALRLLELRETALFIMRELSAFQPRLTKGVLSGCADQYSDICLQAVSEDLKAFQIALLDRDVDFTVLPNPKSGRKEFAEEVVFEAPLKPNGYFAVNRMTVWVRVKVFETQPSVRQKSEKTPDAWQIPLEAAKSVDIDGLTRLIDSTRV